MQTLLERRLRTYLNKELLPLKLPRMLLPLAALLLLAAAILLYFPRAARTSDHQDSPLTVGRPGADITDVFVFPAANPNNVVLAMNVHPLIPAGQAGTVFFDPEVMYQFKIASGGGYRENHVIQFRALGTGNNQRLQIYGPERPTMAGTRSQWVGSAQTFRFNRKAQLANGMIVFAGPRQDAFYFDLAQFFKIVPDRNYKYHPPFGPGVPPSAHCFRKPGVDFLRNYNVLSLIVELPRQMLADSHGKLGVIRVYATTSLQQNGQWVQVERLGRPAVKEAFEAFERHDTTNKSSPWNDPLLPHDIFAFMTSSHGAHRSTHLASSVEHVLVPDEMEADLGARGPARYLAVETKGKSALPTGVVRAVPNFPLGGIKKALSNPYRQFGGRDPSSPVIDLSLGVIFGTLGEKVGLAPPDGRATPCLTSDNVQPPDRGVSKTFPYLGNPV